MFNSSKKIKVVYPTSAFLVCLMYLKFCKTHPKESKFNIFNKDNKLKDINGAESFSLLTYNIRGSNLDNGTNSWENRKPILLDELQTKLAADVIGFQEGLQDQIDFLREKLPSYQATCLLRKVNITQEILTIFYNKNKFDLLEENYIWLSETPFEEYSISWDSNLPRIISYIHLRFKQLPNHEIIVANTHFDHISQKAREKSAELVASYFDKKISKKKIPLFIMGDFNEANYEKTYNIFKENNYQDCINACEESKYKNNVFYTPNSYHDFFGSIVNNPAFYLFQYFEYKSWYGYYPNWKRHHIDWILFKNYNEQLEINVKLAEMYEGGHQVDYITLLSVLKDLKNWRAVIKDKITFPTDHLPIISIIEIKPKLNI
jgi:endonuclease/exonuclease/phosphatase family metal-dependent hydrolase